MKKRILIYASLVLIASTAATVLLLKYLSSGQEAAGISSDALSSREAAILDTVIEETALSGASFAGTEAEAADTAQETAAVSQLSELRVYMVYEADGTSGSSLVWRKEYSYDSQGNVLWEDTYYPSDSDAPQTSYLYTYNEQGQLSGRQTLRTDGGPDTLTEYVYDERGVLTEALSYDSEDALWGRTLYSYDGQGNLIAEQNYGSDGVLADGTDYEYTFDEQDRILTQKQVSLQGHINSLHVYTYDGQGRVLTEETSSPDTGYMKKLEYIYNEDGSLSQILHYSNVSDFDGPCVYDARFEYIYENL